MTNNSIQEIALANLSRDLERQLTASKAEVEELQQQKRNCIEIIEDDTIEKSELKAEVERLRSILADHATFLRKNGFDHQANLLDPK
jgi:hypothetical protein